MLSVDTHAIAPIAPTSTPSATVDWPGTRHALATSSTVINASNASAARDGSCGYCKIFARLIDTATNNRPSSAADAPASATKKLSHPAVAYIQRSYTRSGVDDTVARRVRLACEHQALRTILIRQRVLRIHPHLAVDEARLALAANAGAT